MTHTTSQKVGMPYGMSFLSSPKLLTLLLITEDIKTVYEPKWYYRGRTITKIKT